MARNKALDLFTVVFVSLAMVFVIFTLFLPQPKSGPVVKKSDLVFGKWISTQKIRKDVDFGARMKELDKEFFQEFMARTPPIVLPQLTFMFPDTTRPEEMTTGEVETVVERVYTLYHLLDTNVQGFVDFLLYNGFSTPEVDREEERLIDDGKMDLIYEKYQQFVETLLHHTDEDWMGSARSSLANRLFEYCYSPKTFKHFRDIHGKTESRPLVRFINEVIWYYLARSEWMAWHENTLKRLKKEFEQGKEILYIAGGNDIYQLIAHGIHRIRNIDPIYPTQKSYYSSGWDFLAVGKGDRHGIGDRIEFKEKMPFGKNIVMRRESYKLTGEVIQTETEKGFRMTIPESVTVWSIQDDSGKRLGSYTLERRYVRQDDFRPDPKRAFLISFNELYFLLTASEENWGINPRMFDPEIVIHAKQLRSPLDYLTLMNIRTIQESHWPNRFGSSVIDD